jgi:hypothetical protein
VDSRRLTHTARPTARPPVSQSKSPVWEPRHLRSRSSVPDNPNCAKMAHLRPRVRQGGGTEGIRWGHGGAPALPMGPSSVPFWHTTPSSLPMSISHRCPQNPACPGTAQRPLGPLFPRPDSRTAKESAPNSGFRYMPCLQTRFQLLAAPKPREGGSAFRISAFPPGPTLDFRLRTLDFSGGLRREPVGNRRPRSLRRQ